MRESLSETNLHQESIKELMAMPERVVNPQNENKMQRFEEEDDNESFELHGHANPTNLMLNYFNQKQ